MRAPRALLFLNGRPSAALMDDALNGNSRAAIGFAAFKQTATQQEVLIPAKQSAPLAMLDELWSRGGRVIGTLRLMER
jgi:hypothetical protein